MSKIQFIHRYEDIISVENLLEAWGEFLRGKKSRKDVQEFQRRLMTNILSLNQELKTGTYKHSDYEHFKISDPKQRDIHKAKVRDRLLHHAIYRKLYPFFDKTFISDSFSCRVDKGTHDEEVIKKLGLHGVIDNKMILDLLRIFREVKKGDCVEVSEIVPLDYARNYFGNLLNFDREAAQKTYTKQVELQAKMLGYVDDK